MQNKIYSIIFLLALAQLSFAGNPDRQGAAGAAQLLLNPWARSAGLHTMTTGNIGGLEAMRLNVAGLANIPGNTQIQVGSARYFEGADINLNAIGIAQRVGENGVFGVSIMSVDFGDVRITTTDNPEGTGSTFSPTMFNLGASYAHQFENKVRVGATVRLVSEGTSNVTASAFALDAGVQYVTGAKDAFKFGIALRNVGAGMKFKGEGLSVQQENPNPNQNFELTYLVKSAKVELPSVLNIGVSYDFHINETNMLTLVTNFTSNSFAEDQIGLGLEYTFNKMFSLRGGYKHEFDTSDAIDQSVYSGVAAGFSVDIPFGKEKDRKVAIDYAYRTTNILKGTHNLGIRLDL